MNDQEYPSEEEVTARFKAKHYATVIFANVIYVALFFLFTQYFTGCTQ